MAPNFDLRGRETWSLTAFHFAFEEDRSRLTFVERPFKRLADKALIGNAPLPRALFQGVEQGSGQAHIHPRILSLELELCALEA
jgi:hypothetical protein